MISNSPKNQDEIHKFGRFAAYSAPVIATNFLVGAIAITHSLYAKYFGISLTDIAAILLIARIFDAVTDPAIGYFSDRYYARTGSRRPFVVSGLLLLIPCAYFLFIPLGFSPLEPFNSNETVSSHYFMIAWLSY
ncbi:MFS transporter [Porticoccaceae bacterium]|nr:MFS transporter [Porticoccaceae bacterium]